MTAGAPHDHRTAAARSRAGVAWRAAAAAAIGLTIWATRLSTVASFEPWQRVWFWTVDLAVGAAALVLVLALVRRHPLPVALIAAACVPLSSVAVGAVLLATASVAARLRWRDTAVVGVATVACLLFIAVPYPPSSIALPWWARGIVMSLGVSLVIAVGYAAGQRRELLEGLRERARAAEREASAHVETARAEERARIAGDMHDVVAHRISLIALHAAALGYRDDLSAAQQAEGMRTIEENARAALDELRDVVGVLRSPDSGDDARPAPRLSDLDALVAEHRAAGATVDLRVEVDGVPPTLLGQTAYRVVREALTNAVKHAPGASVTVAVVGEPGDGIAVHVRDAGARTEGAALASSGSGTGLWAMRERVERSGGRFSHGRTTEGYEVTAWLPWTQ